jgi:hypothetical protein
LRLDDSENSTSRRLTENEGWQYQCHVIQPLLRNDDGVTQNDRQSGASADQPPPPS